MTLRSRSAANAVEYARALTMMEEWRSAPVFAMAVNRGPLTERIVRVLGLKTLGAGMRGIGLTGSILCLGAALVAGNALLGMAHPPSARAGALWQAAPKPEASSTSAAANSTATAKPSAARAQNSEPSGGQFVGDFLHRRHEGRGPQRPDCRSVDRPENPGRHSGICARTSRARSASRREHCWSRCACRTSLPSMFADCATLVSTPTRTN